LLEDLVYEEPAIKAEEPEMAQPAMG